MNEIVWPSVAEVVACWDGAKVPPIEVIPFDADKHTLEEPWFSRIDGAQIICSNPMRVTATCLLVDVPKQPHEMQVLYYLAAFCHEYQLQGMSAVVLPGLGRPGIRLWWHHSARYVFPYEDQGALFDWQARREWRFFPTQAEFWREIVEAACVAWRLASEQFALIRIPEFMPEDSVEHQAWLSAKYELARRQHEQFLAYREKLGLYITPGLPQDKQEK